MINLPLVDGRLLIDNTTLDKLLNCPREFEYSRILQRELAAPQPALNFGGAVHEALRVRYEMSGSNALSIECVQAINDKLQKHFDKNPQPENDFRQCALAQNLVGMYNDVYGNEPWSILKNGQGKPMVECSFMFPLTKMAMPKYDNDGKFTMMEHTEVWYTGRIDLQVLDNEGEWVLDHKTTSIYGDGFWNSLAMTAQMPGYCWARKQQTGKLPMGYIINAIRTRAPRKMDEYDPTQGVRRDDFNRQKFYVTQDRIDEWYENTVALVKTLFYHAENDYWPMARKHCVALYGKCQFYSVCGLPRESRLGFLASEQYKDQDWSPLNQPK